MAEITCYEIIKDIFTITIPIVIALYVYRLTTGDKKGEAKLKSLYQLHESVNTVRYQHSIHEITIEKQADSPNSGESFVTNHEFSQRIIDLELARAKLGADYLLVESAYHGRNIENLKNQINSLMLARSERKSSDEISKLSDDALGTIHELVKDLT